MNGRHSTSSFKLAHGDGLLVGNHHALCRLRTGSRVCLRIRHGHRHLANREPPLRPRGSLTDYRASGEEERLTYRTNMLPTGPPSACVISPASRRATADARRLHTTSVRSCARLDGDDADFHGATAQPHCFDPSINGGQCELCEQRRYRRDALGLIVDRAEYTLLVFCAATGPTSVGGNQ